MASISDFSENELLELLQNEQGGGNSERRGMTVAEMRKATGRGAETIRNKIRDLLDAGLMEVNFVYITSINGQPRQVPEYCLVKGRTRPPPHHNGSPTPA